MALPSFLTATDAAASNVFPPNLNVTPFNIGLGAIITAGTPTYTVEHTFDNVFSRGFNPATATWFPHASLAAQTTSKDGNYAFPVQGIRIRVTAGTGTVQLAILQAGVKQ